MSTATLELPGQQRILLDRIPWETYETLVDGIGERQIRLTYDNGSLEILTLSLGHESYGSCIDHLITLLAVELEISFRSGGSTTLKWKRKRKGLEPDKCYWIQHENEMRGKTVFDFKIDPPPDLAVEVDVSRSSLNRMTIYAAFKIPEIWRFDGECLRVYHLHKGKYQEKKQSLAFPFLPLDKFAEFIRQCTEKDETSLLRAFVRWIRSEVVPNR